MLQIQTVWLLNNVSNIISLMFLYLKLKCCQNLHRFVSDVRIRVESVKLFLPLNLSGQAPSISRLSNQSLRMMQTAVI